MLGVSRWECISCGFVGVLCLRGLVDVNSHQRSNINQNSHAYVHLQNILVCGCSLFNQIVGMHSYSISLLVLINFRESSWLISLP